MLKLALVILVLAAVGGVGLATIKGLPRWAPLGHGTVGGIGLLLLLLGALGDGRSLVWLAFGLVAIGFAAGAVLFGVIYRDRPTPRLYLAAHGGINAVGVAILAWAVLAP